LSSVLSAFIAVRIFASDAFSADRADMNSVKRFFLQGAM